GRRIGVEIGQDRFLRATKKWKGGEENDANQFHFCGHKRMPDLNVNRRLGATSVANFAMYAGSGSRPAGNGAPVLDQRYHGPVFWHSNPLPCPWSDRTINVSYRAPLSLRSHARAEALHSRR